MKKVLVAAALLSSMAVQAQGILSSLVSYESIRDKPSAATGNTEAFTNISAEYVFPRSLSFYGGFSVIRGDSYDSSVIMGMRFYTFSPAFRFGSAVPVWPYMGFGTHVDGNSTIYPEVGLRFASSVDSRLDLFARIYSSKDKSLDKHATLGLGLSF